MERLKKNKMQELLEQLLILDEFDIKKALKTAAVTGIIGASAAGLDYRKGLSQREIEKPETAVKVEQPVKAEQSADWQVIKMRVTAYCPCPKCCGMGSPGITASGHKIQSGDVFVAADKRYSFGTKMIIPGYNNNQSVEVLDRGGAIKGNKIDVFFPTHEEALEWGVKNIDVKVQNVR